MNLHFDLPKEQSSIIKVIGVGGGGGNAVNHMFKEGIRGVNYVVCNTDQQALELSIVPNKIQLGPEITQGLGAGSRPEIGEKASLESEAEIKELLSKNTKMVFITAGMGGGTGTGGAPVVAKIAKDMGILTVGIVTTPFSFEGRRKLKQADEGIEKLKNCVDSLIVISNDKIREMFGNLSRTEAFSRADDILTTGAKSISEIITVTGGINVDFADVEYVMKDSGVAIMGSATAAGDDRAMRAVHSALNSPLLNDNNITGAKNILLNITSGEDEISLDEITEITEFIQDAAGNDTDVIFGTCDDDTLGDKINVTLIATGFEDEKKEIIVEEKQVFELETEEIKEPTPTSNEKQSLEDMMRLIDETIDVEQPKEETNFDLFMGAADKHNELNHQPPVEVRLDNEAPQEDAFNFTIKEESKEEVANKDEYSFYTTPKETPKATPPKNEAQERIDRLKNVSYKWDNMAKIRELENVPAYERRGMNLDDTPHSSERNISKFSVDSFDFGDKKRPEIRKNNSYLNDNVD